MPSSSRLLTRASGVKPKSTSVFLVSVPRRVSTCIERPNSLTSVLPGGLPLPIPQKHAGNVLGLAGLKSALEAVFGPLDLQPLSSQIYGLYTALVYLTPIFGGLLADRVLGQRRTVILGAILMAIGHFLMAVEQLFLFALGALILGNGAFKPNISTQVGGLYAPGDPRRDRAFSIFYVGINVGAFLAPLVCGTLGE
jgi:POT family proton-dependent oligopeptide transporter